eukprot:gene6076-biopygen2374
MAGRVRAHLDVISLALCLQHSSVTTMEPVRRTVPIAPVTPTGVVLRASSPVWCVLHVRPLGCLGRDHQSVRCSALATLSSAPTMEPARRVSSATVFAHATLATVRQTVPWCALVGLSPPALGMDCAPRSQPHLAHATRSTPWLIAILPVPD